MQDSAVWGMATMVGMGYTIGYAVRTLSRMRRKLLYPLLRRRSDEGGFLPVVVATNSASKGHPPVAATGYPW
jgi:hypothetical protein